MITSSAIKPYPIEPIATDSSIDQTLADALLASVRENSEQLRGRRIWLACSGGRDSLALAALCLQLYRQGWLPFLPQLLHVDHNLQSQSSVWAKHVAQWAKLQQLPCTVLQAKVKGGDEQAARMARYQVMLAHINQGDVLLLAHHADDQAETLLMRLIQGAGVKGLSAMQAWREQSQAERHNILWRPWLTVRRALITAYAERLKLPYIDDPTNDDGDNVRSGLRRDIMPLLSQYNSNVIENMARSAQLLSDAHMTVSAQAEQDLQQTSIHALSYPSAQRVLDIAKLVTLPIYRQRQLLHLWLTQDEPLPPAKQLVDDVLNLVQRPDNNHQTQLDWYAQNRPYRICRYRQQLYRLSHSWLDWLALPLVEQTYNLSQTKLSNSKPNIITLRPMALESADSYLWQLSVAANELASLLVDDKDELLLRVTLLGRQQKVKTLLATRSQSGKKLYQTLGIPLWLRDSLLVVSAVVINSKFKNGDNERPLLLISPFASWIFNNETSLSYKIENEQHNVIKNILKINN